MRPIAAVPNGDENDRKTSSLTQQLAKPIKEFLIGQVAMASFDDRPRSFKNARQYDWSKGAVTSDPHLHRIVNAPMLQLERSEVIDVRSDVLWVDQDLMHGRTRPWTALFAENAAAI